MQTVTVHSMRGVLMTSKHRWLFNFHKTIEEKTLENEESGHACSLETHPNDILHQNRSEQSCIFDHLKSARELRHSIHVQVLGWPCTSLSRKNGSCKTFAYAVSWHPCCSLLWTKVLNMPSTQNNDLWSRELRGSTQGRATRLYYANISWCLNTWCLAFRVAKWSHPQPWRSLYKTEQRQIIICLEV